MPKTINFSMKCKSSATMGDLLSGADLRKEAVKGAGKSHRRPATLLGEKLDKVRVPAIFSQVLDTVVNLTTGKPPLYQES